MVLRVRRHATLIRPEVRICMSRDPTGPYAVGLRVGQRGDGWYFGHAGSNWGFRCRLVGHFRKGSGMAAMTNGENGIPVLDEIEARVASAYDWDSLDKPVPR